MIRYTLPKSSLPSTYVLPIGTSPTPEFHCQIAPFVAGKRRAIVSTLIVACSTCLLVCVTFSLPSTSPPSNPRESSHSAPRSLPLSCQPSPVRSRRTPVCRHCPSPP